MRELETKSLELLDQIAEDYARRIRKGEPVNIDELVTQYPALESQLRTLLPTASILEHPAVFTSERVIAITDNPPEIQDYRFIRELGRGGMGIVYEAEHLNLGRNVAVKVLPSHMIAQEKARERFQREAKAAARMHHSNIVPVFEVGTVGQISYYSMQLIQGQTLAALIASLQIEADTKSTPRKREEHYDRVAKLGCKLAGALHYAHQRGVLHRDIKPSNILIDESQTAWLTDFGLASLSEDTQSQELVGTLKYLAPERFSGQADSRSDIYSLGLTLYEFITLRDAIAGEDRAVFFAAICSGNIRPLRQAEPGLSKDLATIIEKAIHHDPSQRYPTAADFAVDLQNFLNREPICARPVSSVERLWMWSRRNPMLASMAGALNLLLLLSAVGASLFASGLNAKSKEAQKQTEIAQRNELAAKRVSDYLVDMIQGADPSGLFTGHSNPKYRMDQSTSAFQFIQNAAKQIETEDFSESPLVEAQIKDTIGVALTGQMKMKEAGELLHSSLQIRQRLLHENHPDIASTIHHLGTYEFYRGDPQSAAERFHEALSIRSVLLDEAMHANLSHEIIDDLQLEIARSESALALALAYSRSQPGTEPQALLRSSLNTRVAILGNDHIEVAYCHIASASIFARDLLPAKALEELQLAEQILVEKNGDQRLTEVFSLYAQGTAFQSTGLTDLAVNSFASAGTKMSEVFGPNHPLTMYAQGEIAGALERGGRIEQAEAIYKKVIEFNQEALPNQPFLGRSWDTLGNFYAQQGKHDEAIEAYQKSLNIYQECGLRPDHPLVVLSRRKMALSFIPIGRIDDSFSSLAKVVELFEKQPRVVAGYELYTSLTHMAYLTMWHHRQQFPEVIEAVVRVGRGETDPKLIFHLLDAGTRGRCTQLQAEELLTLVDRWITCPVNDYDRREAIHFRGRVLYFLGRAEEALQILQQPQPSEPRQYQANLFICLCLKDLGRIEEAHSKFAETTEWLLARVDTHYAESLRAQVMRDPVTLERPLPKRMPTTIQFQWDQTAYAELVWRLMNDQ